MKKKLIFFIYFLLCWINNIVGYGLPPLPLGTTNILEGGPVRPNPGFYYFQYLRYYHAYKFTDNCGNELPGVHKPNLNVWAAATQLVYQTEQEIIPHAVGGAQITLPMYLEYSINSNCLGLKSSGAGLGDLMTGLYLQWKPIMVNDQPRYVHRVEFDVFWPSGRNQLPERTINAGYNAFFFVPNWSATLYLRPELGISWRLQYLIPTKIRKIDFKAGSAIFGNFTLEWAPNPNLYLAFVGYFLGQVQTNRNHGIKMPDSREKVIALGPGCLIKITPNIILFSYIYFETFVRNRPQGASGILRLLVHF